MIICVVGLGYVGLPLAMEFAKKFDTIGFDINQTRIDGLKNGIDITGEVESYKIKESNLKLSSNPEDIKNADFVIVAVPTPIDKNKNPDLKYIKGASELVGKNMKKGAIIVFESTVYPGTTDEVCKEILEKESGMKFGEDFKLGYSPERINPGDTVHTIDKIVKIVSGSDEETTDKIAEVYSSIITAGVYKAKDIRTAEAAKVIENIQRDMNIGLMNELSLIFEKMGIDTHDVLKAAGTKWNFHKYTPGLVGGHCIGIDPYYLTSKAEEVGYEPRFILAGRRVNEYMAEHIKNLVIKKMNQAKKVISGSKVLILGLAFKPNVNDTRNSKVEDLINHLKKEGIEVVAYDPFIEENEVLISRIKHRKDVYK